MREGKYAPPEAESFTLGERLENESSWTPEEIQETVVNVWEQIEARSRMLRERIKQAIEEAKLAEEQKIQIEGSLEEDKPVTQNFLTGVLQLISETKPELGPKTVSRFFDWAQGL